VTESATFLWKTYPYLWTTLLYLGVLLLGVWPLPRGQRRLVALSGLMNLLAAPFCLFLQGSYWFPKRVGGFPLGPEDFLISFFVAALAWLLAAWPFRHRLHRAQGRESPWRRYALVSSPTVGFYLLLVWVGLDPMTALIITLLVAGGALLFLRPCLWSLSLSGFLIFPPLYLLLVKLCYWVWPESVCQWNLQSFWGQLIGGLPLGEIVWALAYGPSWPVYVGYVFQVSLLGCPHMVLQGD